MSSENEDMNWELEVEMVEGTFPEICPQEEIEEEIHEDLSNIEMQDDSALPSAPPANLDPTMSFETSHTPEFSAHERVVVRDMIREYEQWKAQRERSLTRGLRNVGVQSKHDREGNLDQTVEARVKPERDTIICLKACERYFDSDERSDGVLGKLEFEFYNGHIRCFYDMTGIDPAWQPRSRSRLTNEGNSENAVDLDLTRFPPRFGSTELKSLLDLHEGAVSPVINSDLAKQYCQRFPENKKFCNVVVLVDGFPQDLDLPGVWLLHHLFPRCDRLEVTGTVVARDMRCHRQFTVTQFNNAYVHGGGHRRRLHYSLQCFDINTINEQSLAHSLNASALFLLIDDTTKIHQNLSHVQAILHRCEIWMPPVVLFVATNEAADPDENIEDDLTNRLIALVGEVVQVSVIRIVDQVENLRQAIFRKLKEKWSLFIARHFLPEPEINIPDHIIVDTDPIGKAFREIQGSICLREQNNIGIYAVECSPEEINMMMEDWRSEWGTISAYGRVIGTERIDDLYRAIDRHADMTRHPPGSNGA